MWKGDFACAAFAQPAGRPSGPTSALRPPSMPDNEEAEPLRGEDASDGTTKPERIRRWPWACLGFSVGLLAVFVQGQLAAPVGEGSCQESTCGGFDITHPPALVRRALDNSVTNVLVTGGAGFIASHFALMLIDHGGYDVTVVDDLSRGSIETVLRLQVRAACLYVDEHERSHSSVVGCAESGSVREAIAPL